MWNTSFLLLGPANDLATARSCARLVRVCMIRLKHWRTLYREKLIDSDDGSVVISYRDFDPFRRTRALSAAEIRVVGTIDFVRLARAICVIRAIGDKSR